jgi:hypothetical protein
MLDYYPVDMQTVVYEFPAINPGILPTLDRYKFEADSKKRRLQPYAGELIMMDLFRGPYVGDLIEMIEARRPWLKERQPVSVLA